MTSSGYLFLSFSKSVKIQEIFRLVQYLIFCLSEQLIILFVLHLQLQVIRVKWSLHAREEIVFELLQHLRGNATKSLLQGIQKSTREMMEEQEAVRGRLFTIQDVTQSTLRAWLQVCLQI